MRPRADCHANQVADAVSRKPSGGMDASVCLVSSSWGKIMNRRVLMACKLAGLLMAASAIESRAVAQGVLFCIGNGQQVKADRFE